MSINYMKCYLNSILILFSISTLAIDETTVEKWENLPVISCDVQDSFTEISLTSNNAAAQLLPRDKKTISRAIKTNDPSFYDVSASYNVLFQGCVSSSNQLVIKRIISKHPDIPFYNVYTESNSTITGINTLYNRLSAKNQEPLEIRVVRNTEDQEGFLLSSLPNSKVLFFAVGKYVNNAFLSNSVVVFVGNELVSKNSFDFNPCEIGEFKISKFTIDKASFKIKYCSFLGGGFTTGYNIIEVELSDKNPRLPIHLSGKTVILNSESLKTSINYNWNHHNTCDSLVIKVSALNATYGLVGPAVLGCFNIVVGAPLRNLDDIRNTSLYQISYGNNRGEIKESLFKGHYLFQSGLQ